MSGNFTQRGEIAVMDKFTRARHAVMAGADVVFELPTVFATANAELFAKGAVHLLRRLPGEKILCFGAEGGTREEFLQTAKVLSNESKEFKKALKTKISEGISLARAKAEALGELQLDANEELLKSPNNILGIEYTRAILDMKADMEIYPITRVGGGYNDAEMYEDLSSATAIRAAIASGKVKKIKKNVPAFVYGDLPDKLPDCDDLTFYSLMYNDKQYLKGISDCTEGLENRIKACLKQSASLAELKDKVYTKRYTATRISRIMTASLLGISKQLISRCLKSPLYLNVLAIRGGQEKMLATLCRESQIPLITRKNDVLKLKKTDAECFEKDVFANDVYGFVTGKPTNEYMMIKI